jgi:hypothetical protein
LGGNVAGRPLDLVHFTHSAYAPADGTGGNSKSPMHWDTELLSAEAMSNATIFHEITDGWFGGKLGYGIGLEGSWNGTDALLPNICGLKYLGHGGQDYGSNMMGGYFPDLNMSIAISSASASLFQGEKGMNCSLRYNGLNIGPGMAIEAAMNIAAVAAGLEPPCPQPSYEPPPASYCSDTSNFGSFNLQPATCADAIYLTNPHTGKPFGEPDGMCQFLEQNSLHQIAIDLYYGSAGTISYQPPDGMDPYKTAGIDLCRSTCGDIASGPCWLNGIVNSGTSWCEEP